MTPPDLPTGPTAGEDGPAADDRETAGAGALVARALAASPSPLAVARDDGTLVFVNPAMMRAAGFDPPAPPPASLGALAERFRAGGFDDPAATAAEVLRTGRAFERDVTDFRTGRTLALCLWPITHGSTVSGVAFTARDVTRRHEAERLRGALVSLVSHELRTPLTSIGGFAELLADDDELPAEAREFLAIIRDETQRLARMVTAFFDGVRTEASGAAAACEPVSLGELAREAAGHFARRAAERGVSLTLREGPRTPPVAASRRAIACVVASLLDEALERAEAGAAVTVSTWLEASTVSLCVESRPAHGTPDERPPGGHEPLREAVGQHGGRLVRESEAGAERVRLTFPRL
ncbi:MAG TPA: histidine kinase dimerization/phospho-acceptor domain-containing protein [Pyrinomonadaceae bacterium]|nr:histidine kinase dimerization/phospho-acceptor domain-containing protein [Pyrinomonadaceae bacterium]